MVEGTSALVMNPPAARPRRKTLPERPAARERQAAAIPSKKAEANPHMTIRLGAVLLFTGAMAVLLFIVYNYMQLSTLSNANRNAVDEIQMLKKEEGVLIRYAEASVSLSEVAEYAAAELGMIKPVSGQVVYIGVPAEDRAEVVAHQGFWGSVRQLFNTMGMSVAEFFD